MCGMCDNVSVCECCRWRDTARCWLSPPIHRHIRPYHTAQANIPSPSGPPSSLVLRKSRRLVERGTEGIFQFSYLHELFACGHSLRPNSLKLHASMSYSYKKQGIFYIYMRIKQRYLAIVMTSILNFLPVSAWRKLWMPSPTHDEIF